MITNKKEQNNQSNTKEETLQNKTDHFQEEEGVSADKDGFRYDYDDSSDLN